MDELDEFTLLSVFDFLDIADLIKMAQLYPHLVESIGQHFLIGRFHLEQQHITVATDGGAYTHEPVGLDGELDITNSFDLTLFMLRAFGHLLSHITVEIRAMDNAESLAILAQIKESCTTARVCVKLPFHLTFVADDNRRTSFDRVSQVQLHGVRVYGELPLNQLFPDMQQLDIRRPHAIPSLAHHFEHLTDFAVLPVSETYVDPMLLQFVRLNPQLRRFKTPAFGYNQTYLQYVSACLPMLEELHITGVEFEDGSDPPPTHFARVKRFAMELANHFGRRRDRYVIMPALTFDRLESFELAGRIEPHNVHKFVSFFERHNRTLKGLEMTTNFVPDAELPVLFGALPALEELTMNWMNAGGLRDLLAFLAHGRGTAKLRRFTFRATHAVVKELGDEALGVCGWMRWRVVPFYTGKTFVLARI